MGLYWKIWLWTLCVLAAGLTAGSAHAQSTVPVPNNSVIFASPSGTSLQSPEARDASLRERLNAPDALEAPHHLFQPEVPEEEFPPPSQLQMNALQNMLKENQKDWTQMTPEEIMGLPAPDKAAADQARKNPGQDSDLSPLESFLRSQRLAQTGTTNTARYDENQDFLDEKTGLPNPARLAEMRNGYGDHSQIFNRLLENARGGNSLDFRQYPDQAWAGVFQSQTYQQTPQEVANMQAFIEMLHPTPPPTDSHSPLAGRGFYSAENPLPDPDLEPPRPGYNPAGASYQPLDSGINRPRRLTGLPGITAEPTLPTITPSWVPQPAPWMQDSPQLFVNPVRKY